MMTARRSVVTDAAEYLSAVESKPSSPLSLYSPRAPFLELLALVLVLVLLLVLLAPRCWPRVRGDVGDEFWSASNMDFGAFRE